MQLKTTNTSYHVYVSGAESSQTIVFFHGFGLAHQLWQKQLEFFSKSYRVLAFDWPGHGLSDYYVFTLESLAEDVYQCLGQLKISAADFVGSSFGGKVAIQVHEQYPQLFNSLTLVGALGSFLKDESYPAGLNIERIRTLATQFEGDYAKMLDIFFRSLFSSWERTTDGFEWAKQFRKEWPLPERDALFNCLTILETMNLRSALDHVQCPLHFLNGTEDYICPMAVVEYMKDQYPFASFHEFERCSHFPFITKADEFNEILTERL